MMKIKRIITSPTSIRLLTVFLNFFVGVLVNRSLGLELKGQYTTITNYANFIQLILNFGICYIYPVLKNEKNNAKEVVMTLIWIQTIFMSLISIIGIFLFPSKKIIQILLLSVLLICNSQILFISLIEDIRKRNNILLVSTGVFIILNALVFIFDRGDINAIVIILMVKYAFEIILCCKDTKLFKFNIRCIDSSIKNKILVVALPTAFLAVLISCNYNLDILMLNWMGAGDKQVGIYGVSYSLSSILWIVPDVFKELIYNKSAKSEADSKLVIKSILFNAILCVIICIGFFVLGKMFLGLVYGEKYVEAFGTTLTLFIGIIPMIAFKLIHPIYVNNGKSIVVASLLIIAVFANVISSYLFIPHYGAYGAAIASVISYSICGALFFFRYRKDYCSV